MSSIIGRSRAANDTDKDLSIFATKITFIVLERKTYGFLLRAVEDVFGSLNYIRDLLEYRFNYLGVSKEEYKVVGKV